MRPEDFDFALPEELIAQAPADRRDASRLLVIGGAAPEHRSFGELPDLLPPGTLVIANDARVLPARLFTTKPSGGRIEVLLVRPERGDTWVCLMRGKVPPGTRLTLCPPGHSPPPAIAAPEITVIERHDDGTARVQVVSDDLVTALDAWGELPLPPYIRRTPDAVDRDRYQTTFARTPGAVAAPTAGLHFTDEVRHRLAARGATWATVTLHVGLGTFAPLKPEQLERGELHEELYDVPAETAAAYSAARAEGRPVLAIGTTVARTLESACDDDGRHLHIGSGHTRLFIRPGYRFRAVDALLSNFHLPCSSLLMLVSAFAGTERVLAAYRAAVAERYRFFSYGDATLSWRAP